MYDETGTRSVKEQLIIAGITELESHGIADFSLRRVAAACNISCAAPYRHFQDKDQMISEIFDYIRTQLYLLINQVRMVFSEDAEQQLVESGIAYIRFCLANPHFRAILTLSGDTLPLKDVVKPLLAVCRGDLSDSELSRKEVMIRSLIYGAAVLLESGEAENSSEFTDDIRCIVRDIIKR